MNTMATEGVLGGYYAWSKYPTIYAKSVNLSRKLKDAYNSALDEFDLLVMPTTTSPANPLPPADGTPSQFKDTQRGTVDNTGQFDMTGHPALAVPIGFVPAAECDSIMLPASMQIVGRFWDEGTILRAAYAWEGQVDWKAEQ